jgi:1,4-alpha-glucan branching enzyme
MTTIPAGELAALLAIQHKDPHALLGAHPTPAGVVVRAFRPDAVAVSGIEDAGGRRHALARVHDAGLFEGLIPGRKEVFGYRLEVGYDSGLTVQGRDPYAYLPTLGELDVYLASEGRH